MLALPLVLVAFAVINFVFTSMVAAGEPSASAPIIARIVNAVLGLLGLVSFIMVPVGLVVGIITLAKKDPSMPPSEPPMQPPVEPPAQPPTTG